MSLIADGRAWVRKGQSLLRFGAFDDSSEHGRSQERYRRAALGTLAALAARGLQIVTSFVSVPLTLSYLGGERYGMWGVISSTIMMFSFADLGIGNGLLNAIADAHGRKDRAVAVTYVSSAFYSLTAIAALLAVGFVIAYPFVSWAGVFNVTSVQAAAEAGPSVAVFVASFLVSMPLGVAQRIRMGYQEGFVDSAWTTVGNLGAFIGVLLAIWRQMSLPWLVFAMAGVPALMQIANAAVLFGRTHAWLRPQIAAVGREAAARVMGTGGYFFILQIAGAVAYQSDSLILAQMLGTEAVTRYAVPMKLFQLTPMILGFAYNALWPAYGESIARGDMHWARRTLARSMTLTFAIAGAVSILLVLVGKPVIAIWIGWKSPDLLAVVMPTYLVLFAMGAWAVVGAVSGSLGAFLNGAGILRFQVICAVLMMVANVVFSIALTRRLGLSGVVWGSVLSQLIFILIPMWFYLRRWFARSVIATEVG